MYFEKYVVSLSLPSNIHPQLFYFFFPSRLSTIPFSRENTEGDLGGRRNSYHMWKQDFQKSGRRRFRVQNGSCDVQQHLPLSYVEARFPEIRSTPIPSTKRKLRCPTASTVRSIQVLTDSLRKDSNATGAINVILVENPGISYSELHFLIPDSRAVFDLIFMLSHITYH
jgi:hypothetical protein